MIILGIILIVISIAAIITIGMNDESDYTIISWFLGILLCSGFTVFIVGVTEDNSEKKSLKTNTLEIEIKQEIINGQEVSRDTIYIFTPKN